VAGFRFTDTLDQLIIRLSGELPWFTLLYSAGLWCYAVRTDTSVSALGMTAIHRYVSDDRKFNPHVHWSSMDGSGQKTNT
jgi:hypothetical protein